MTLVLNGKGPSFEGFKPKNRGHSQVPGIYMFFFPIQTGQRMVSLPKGGITFKRDEKTLRKTAWQFFSRCLAFFPLKTNEYLKIDGTGRRSAFL